MTENQAEQPAEQNAQQVDPNQPAEQQAEQRAETEPVAEVSNVPEGADPERTDASGRALYPWEVDPADQLTGQPEGDNSENQEQQEQVARDNQGQPEN